MQLEAPSPKRRRRRRGWRLIITKRTRFKWADDVGECGSLDIRQNNGLATRGAQAKIVGTKPATLVEPNGGTLLLASLFLFFSLASSANCQRQPSSGSSNEGTSQPAPTNRWPSAHLAKLGLIRGVWLEHEGRPPVACFLGIPYAGAPVGSLRFMPPPGLSSGSNSNRGLKEQCRLAAGWPEAQAARPFARFAPECVRLSDWLPAPANASVSQRTRAQSERELQSEDCLNVNVFVPLLASAHTEMGPRRGGEGPSGSDKQNDINIEPKQQQQLRPIKSNYPFRASGAARSRDSVDDNHQLADGRGAHSISQGK